MRNPQFYPQFLKKGHSCIVIALEVRPPCTKLPTYIHINPMLRAELASDWLTTVKYGAYLTFDVISLRYKDKGTSLMTSQWRFWPPSAFLTSTVRPSNTVFIRWFRPDQCDSWDFKAAETFQNVTNIIWAWDKFVTPCLLPRIREFIHT